MGCMKCGRDIAPGQTFCQKCLEEMERYPVKPGTPLIIPSRRQDSARRAAPRRKNLSPEEQVKRLRKANRILSLLLALSLMIAVFLGYIAVLHMMEEERFLPGQNYSSIETLPD